MESALEISVEDLLKQIQTAVAESHLRGILVKIPPSIDVHEALGRLASNLATQPAHTLAIVDPKQLDEFSSRARDDQIAGAPDHSSRHSYGPLRTSPIALLENRTVIEWNPEDDDEDAEQAAAAAILDELDDEIPKPQPLLLLHAHWDEDIFKPEQRHITSSTNLTTKRLYG